MDDQTLAKAMTLLPLVDDGKFMFSCAFEPTLHPHFIDLLKKIPGQYRKKVFFTTNLTTKLSDDFLRELSETDIHHINISLDSFNPVLFERLRKGAKFATFIDNLERLVRIFSRNSKSPPIRYVTMVLKSNLNEIPELFERCHTEYHASENEFSSAADSRQRAEKIRHADLGVGAYHRWRRRACFDCGHRIAGGHRHSKFRAGARQCAAEYLHQQPSLY